MVASSIWVSEGRRSNFWNPKSIQSHRWSLCQPWVRRAGGWQWIWPPQLHTPLRGAAHSPLEIIPGRSGMMLQNVNHRWLPSRKAIYSRKTYLHSKVSTLKLSVCTEGEFSCANGDCIRMEERCDQVSSVLASQHDDLCTVMEFLFDHIRENIAQQCPAIAWIAINISLYFRWPGHRLCR